MYSCNAPIPGRVDRVASGLAPELAAFDRVRDRHTLLVKRFESASRARLRERLRQLLDGEAPVEARLAGVDYFARPPTGAAPVVYLAIESPGIRRLHRRLCEEFGAVAGLEGEDYTPHVTIARGGDVADAERLAEREVGSVAWTVSELTLWSREYREPLSRIPLRG